MHWPNFFVDRVCKNNNSANCHLAFVLLFFCWAFEHHCVKEKSSKRYRPFPSYFLFSSSLSHASLCFWIKHEDSKISVALNGNLLLACLGGCLGSNMFTSMHSKVLEFPREHFVFFASMQNQALQPMQKKLVFSEHSEQYSRCRSFLSPLGRGLILWIFAGLPVHPFHLLLTALETVGNSPLAAFTNFLLFILLPCCGVPPVNLGKNFGLLGIAPSILVLAGCLRIATADPGVPLLRP